MAYGFWLRLEQARYEQRLSKADLHERTGIARTTIDNLQTSTRPPQPRIVHALADALGIDRTEAARLAGLLPTQHDPAVDVRAAIAASTAYTPQQKEALLATVDVFDQANRTGGRRDVRTRGARTVGRTDQPAGQAEIKPRRNVAGDA